MEPDRWRQIKEILDAVLDSSAEQRERLLGERCNGDEELRREVVSLLAAHDEAALRGEFFGAEDQPERVGPYRILRPIAKGGMGVVYLAEQLEPMRRQVAVKLIKIGMDTREVVARFELERQALALMSHPHIAQVFDAGSTVEGRPYFAMEYVPGVPITEYCDANNLDIRARLELFLKVCDAIQHAHQKGVVHRDIKPSNVLVMRRDAEVVPKIIDFGIAKATSVQLARQTLYTRTGLMIGTPEYVSPEQASMSEAGVDTRTDVYSLGVLLYELLTGVLPFSRSADPDTPLDEILRRIRTEEPVRPSTRVSSLGQGADPIARSRRSDTRAIAQALKRDLDWIALKALEKDPARRFASASEFASDVRRHLADEPVLAGPPGAGYRARKFAKRHRFGVVVAATGVIALAGFAATAVLQARRTARERDRAERVSEFLVRLFQGSDPKQARGKETKVREILDEGSQRIERDLQLDPLVRARLMDTMGQVYSQLGLYDKAATLLETAVQLRTRELGGANQETLFSKAMLGYVWYRQGRFADAERITLETREVRTRLNGPADRLTLICTSTLTLIRMGLGHYDEAIREQQAALEHWRRTTGLEDPDALIAAANLAIVQQMAGHRAEAAALHQEILAIRRRVIGVDHPETPRTMQQLAGIWRAQGRARDAEQLDREALDIRRRVLGPEHTETAFSLTSLASDLQSEGRFREAEALHTEAITIQRRAVGAEHPDTLWAMHARADMSIAQQRYAEAERLHREVLEIRERVLGPGHPDTQHSFLRLASLEALQGRHDPALAWIRRALESGSPSVEMISREVGLASLRSDPEFLRLVAAAQRTTPAPSP